MVQKRKREHDGLKLTDKHHPKLGIVSAMFGLVSIVIFCAVCVLSGKNGGSAGMAAGAVGLLCMGLSIFGFACAWISLRQENIRTLFPTIGAVINGLLMVSYMIVYAWGSSL